MSKIKQIIWDWNGTLLDDVGMCVNVMNVMLKSYSMPPISEDRYKQIFDFPVKEYYSRLGFDFNRHAFEKVGHEFMDYYFQELPNCLLFSDAKNILDHFKQLEIKQLILSAMEHEALEMSLKQKGIHSYFDKVQGIDNHLANGKKELARELLKSSGVSAQETLFIGDTVHDLQVAQSIGCQCILISRGHFSKERLLANHNLVLDSLTDLIDNFDIILPSLN